MQTMSYGNWPCWWSTRAKHRRKTYSKSMIPLRDKGRSCHRHSMVNGVLSIAACAIYIQIYIQSRGYRASDNSFNDRARQHGCNFQRNRDVCHFEELDHLERSPANHIFLHFLIWNLTLPLKLHPPYTQTNKSHLTCTECKVIHKVFI